MKINPRLFSSLVAAAVVAGVPSLCFLTLGAFTVTGPSMEPALRDGEAIVAEKATYLLRAPRRGEVIVFCDRQDRHYIYIKRVVGLPGETLSVVEDSLVINGQPLSEPYIGNTYLADFPARTLGANEYFALGDSRLLSKDSRNFGPIRREEIVGRAWIVYNPVKHLSWAPHGAD